MVKRAARFLAWCALVAGLAHLYLPSAPESAAARLDSAISLTVLTQAGPVAMTAAAWLPGALAAEMPAAFEPEALKAQAVAARTYAMSARRHADADLCVLNGGCCIAYKDEAALRALWGGGYEKYMAAIEAAILDTDGQYLTYGGEAIQAVFHASSAGSTEESGAIWSPAPYLVSVPTPETPENTPGLVTTVRFTPEELADALDISPAGDPGVWLDEPVLDGAGRVAYITVGGKRFAGGELRGALGLRSTAFAVSWDGEQFTFTVSGHGHGVGLSQYGAQAYAAMGWGYEAILAHYYPGTTLTSLSSR